MARPFTPKVSYFKDKHCGRGDISQHNPMFTKKKKKRKKRVKRRKQ